MGDSTSPIQFVFLKIVLENIFRKLGLAWFLYMERGKQTCRVPHVLHYEKQRTSILCYLYFLKLLSIIIFTVKPFWCCYSVFSFSLYWARS